MKTIRNSDNKIAYKYCSKTRTLEVRHKDIVTITVFKTDGEIQSIKNIAV